MRIQTLAAASAALFLTSAAAFASDIMIKDAYARSATPSAQSGAAFFEIHNMSGQDDRLIGASAEMARRVELHSHSEDANGVMRMSEIEGGIPIAQGGHHKLARGGDHVMLMGLATPLEQGAEITLTLTFEQAGDVVVQVPVDHKRKPKHGHGH